MISLKTILETLYIIVPTALGFYLGHMHLKKSKQILSRAGQTLQGSPTEVTKMENEADSDEVLIPTQVDVAPPQELEPIKWKSLIPDNPTLQQFSDAWYVIFEDHLSNSKIVNLIADDLNSGFEVETSKGTHLNGGLGEYTDTPELDDKNKIWYRGGITWDRDKSGIRFYFIDKHTLLPAHWEEAQTIAIIRNFLKANWDKGSQQLGGLQIAPNKQINH